MTPLEHRRLTDLLLPAVLAAGRIEIGYFEAGCTVGTKADRSPVTDADTEVETLLLARLAEIFPGLAIISEEAFAAGSRPRLTDPFLLVDPLDGTKQFVAGYPEFTINIALVAANSPVYGLIYAPALSDFLVTDGRGRALRARIDPKSDHSPASLEQAAPAIIKVRDRSAITASGGLIALQSRSRNLEACDRFLRDFPISETRRLGSSYKFCLIAAGVADIYPQLGDTYEWDTAAGEAILTAAGGVVCDLQGQPLVYGREANNYLNPTFAAACAPLTELRSSADTWQPAELAQKPQ